MDEVNGADEIFILGPAEAKIGLRDKVVKARQFRPSILGFETADSITYNQKVAKVVEFFGQKRGVN